MEIRVNMTDIRARLSALVGQVEIAGDRVIIQRFGVASAALVSMDDLARIMTAEADEIAGAVNPRTGVRGALVTVAELLGVRGD